MTLSKANLWKRLRLRLRKRKDNPKPETQIQTPETQVRTQNGEESQEADAPEAQNTPIQPTLSQQLHNAVSTRDLDKLERLLKNEDVLAQTDINCQNFDGRTPLMRAILAGHYEMLLLFLRHGADTGIRDHGNNSALKLATFQGDTRIKKAVVEVICSQATHEESPKTSVRQRAWAGPVEKKQIPEKESQLSLRNTSPSIDRNRAPLERGQQRDGSIITDGGWSGPGPLGDMTSTSRRFESASNTTTVGSPGPSPRQEHVARSTPTTFARAMTTTMATTTSLPLRQEPRRNDRSLAQYPCVNEKGAVGWSPGSSFSTSSQFRPSTTGPRYKSLASYPAMGSRF